MIFTANNGIRFRDKEDFSFVGPFIAEKEDHVTIYISDDLLLSFHNGNYEGSFKIPF